ncbi:MAG: FliM/FliN family flagellar motor switch protein [Vicinamibacterales bacterium]
MEIALKAVADALVAELKNAVDAITAAPMTVAVGPSPHGAGWVTPIALSGQLAGSVDAWFDDDGAAGLTMRVLASEARPNDAEILDMLRELWTQAASAVALNAGFAGLTLSVGTPHAGNPAGALVSSYAATMADGPLGAIAVSGSAVALTRPAAAPLASSAEQASSVKLDVVLDIDLPLVVRFGRTVMTLKALSALGPGSIVDMGRSPDEPVEMLVGEAIIARGEVVIVGGNYGIRITDLVSHAERVRAMEA